MKTNLLKIINNNSKTKIILFWKDNTPSKLCGGTRLQVKRFRKNIIEVTIITQYEKKKQHLIPEYRPMCPSEFKHFQFPVKL
jgi:hypothetical protein